MTSDALFGGVLDAGGRLLLSWADARFPAVTGYTLAAANALGGWQALVHPADRAELAQALGALGAERSATLELRVQRPDGARRWLALALCRDTLESANRADPALTVLASLRDVDAAKRARIALEVQKELFEKLVAVAQATSEQLALESTLRNTLHVAARLTRSGHGSIFIFDERGGTLHCILARGAVEPMERDQIVGRVMRHGLAGWVARHQQTALIHDTAQDDRWLTPPNEPYSARSALAVPILRSGALLGVLTLAHPQPGHFSEEDRHWMEAAAAQMALALDNARLYASVEQELTERRRTEAILRDTASRLEIVAHTTNDGIWEWNLLTNEFTWSERLLAILGTTPESLGNDPSRLASRVHPDDRRAAQQALQSHLAGREGAFQAELRFRQDNGRYLWLHVAAQVLHDAQGQPTRLIGSITDISERKLFEKRLTHQAFHDALTGLPNRMLFMDRLEQAISYTGRRPPDEPRGVALLFLDLDQFKLINDRYGHATGDALLQSVAARLLTCVRRTDTVARLSGDEFIVLLPHIGGEDEVLQVAQQISHALSVPFPLEVHELPVSTSIGISLFPRDGRSAADLIEKADQAMYHAKQHGLPYHVYSPGLDGEETDRRLTLASDLHQALQRQEFQLYYQPEFSLADGTLQGVEALLRWQHPTRGLLLPTDFLPMAEEAGLVPALGQWVLHEALVQLQRWHGPQGLSVSINLSARQLVSADLLLDLLSLLDALAVPPDLLQVEIPETVLLREADHLMEPLQRLHQSGIRLAVDDFGAGLTSLRYLKLFPISVIKVDRRFVNLLDPSANDNSLLASYITLAHTMNLTVIAKGVEFDHQRHHLRALGCDAAQGYLLGRPRPADALVELLTSPPP